MKLGYVLYGAAVAIAAGLFLIGAAHAEPPIGQGVVCDTQEQAERYVEILSGEPQVAIAAVNAEYESADACAYWTVMFIPDGEVAQISNESGRYRIVRIIVLAQQTPAGMSALPPKQYYAIARMKGFEI